MKKTRRIATIIGSAAAVVIVLATLRVWAAGIPNSNALNYSGVIENAAGEPMIGTHDIEVRFWSAASSGSVLCSTNADDVALQSGRFSLPLVDECTDAVHDAPDVWVEIIVDATPLGRSKVGAVPYAVEADRAVVSQTATVADTADRLGTLTPTSVQQRVSATCNAGSSIRTINTDGTVVCEDDTVLTESQVDAYANNNGYALATALATKQNRVSAMCAAGQAIRLINADGTVTCETDDNTTYSAGTGLSLNGTTFSPDTNYVQRRVSATCAAGQSIRAIAADGTVTCGTDHLDPTANNITNMRFFYKGGNNGTVTCTSFCTGHTSFGPTGTCVGAQRTDTNEYVSCETQVDGIAPDPAAAQALCFCARPY